ncbi:MAG: Plug and carboxypeptidase regulatory-like domain-containing protein [Pyrinomonadaceae bacterium]|nr:Plug and carboxypeptidase regulatory-like domain-containing protein [Pyrinomonadaceae bacterium]
MSSAKKSWSPCLSLSTLVGVALLLACSAFTVPAQTVVGRISGTVTDSSGAVVANVSVTATNTGTNLTRTATTDGSGFYTMSNLPIGTYVVTAEQVNFKKAIQEGISLTGDARLTIDLALEAGQVSETVQITTSGGETVNTTSGEIARVIDTQQVQNLALNGRNYIQLLSLVPGVALLTDDQLELTTSLATGNQSINGNRGQTNNVTVDGGINLQSGSNASQINNVGIDYIQEVKIQTSNFSAEYGRNSGAQVSLVTRSGGNQFHGSAFEFLRNDKLDARPFFAPIRPTLRFNDFGYSFGGPIIKDKLFFFGGQEWKYIRRLSSAQRRTSPTLAELNGDFSFRLRGADGIVGTNDDGLLRDPNSTLPCTTANRAGCFGGTNVALRNIIPTNRITTDGAAIASVYRTAIGLATGFINSPVANNITFQQPNPLDYREDLFRLDYRFNERHSLYGRYIHDKNVLIDPFGTFITSQLPTSPSNRMRPGTSIQLSYTWLVTPTLINEAKITGAWVAQRIPPAGDLWKRETYGFQFQQLFTGGGRFENSIPDTTITGFASFFGAARSLLSPTTDITGGDTITYTRANHTFKTGASITRNRIDQNARTTYAGNVDFSTGSNTRTSNNAFADALLGNFRTYSEQALDPLGFFRFTQFEAFGADSWKVSRNLSLEIGVRYQYGLPIYTQANNLANFDPSLYDPAQAVTILANGNIDPTRGGNRLNGLIRAGDGVPPEELGRVPGGDSATVRAVPTGAPRGLYDPHHYFMPRVGLAYSPFDDNKTAIRAGFGMYYDRVEGNLIFPSLSNPPYATSASFNNANLSNITGGSTTAAPFAQINAVNPDLDNPYTMSYSLSVQRELPYGIFAEAAYVGNLGRHLIRQPDINQPTFDALRANIPPGPNVNVNALRPYKGYTAIRMRLSDATSNYHGLQLYAAKRRGNLLMTTSYTWSKVLTDASGLNDNPEDPFNRRFNYGPATFDRRHIFAVTYTYAIKMFSRTTGFTKALLDGYEISGITRLQTGPYLTVTATGNSALGNRRADCLVPGDGLFPNGERGPNGWADPAAFAAAPDSRRGTCGPGTLLGPGAHSWDFSLRRRIGLTEKVRLQLQMDIFNAFNRTNFRDLDSNRSNAAFGTISTASPPRNIQFGLKFTF